MTSEDSKPHRVNESPFTFLRSRSLIERNTSSALTGLAEWFEEMLAVLGPRTGNRARSRVYAREELGNHEPLDTLAMRRAQIFFESGAAKTDSKMRVVFFVRECPEALGILEHAVGRILENSDFLKNPENCWVCPPQCMHILLAECTDRKSVPSLMNCSPVRLKLVRLVWRRNGSLWAQWGVERGNIDRLRMDIRLMIGGGQIYEGEGEDLKKCRPLSVETLLLTAVHTPNSLDFRQVRSITEKINMEISGTIADFYKATVIRNFLGSIGRELPLMKSYPKTDGDVSRLLWGLHLLRHSASIKRIVLEGIGVFAIGVSIGFLTVKHRNSFFKIFRL